MGGADVGQAEIQRRRYLALMDIQPYYARVTVANARPSPALAPLPQAKSPTAPALRRTSRAAPPGKPGAQAAAESAAAPLSPDVHGISRPARAVGMAGDARRNQGSGEVERSPVRLIRPLYYLRVDKTLALLCGDDWEGTHGAAARNLLANILKALGKHIADDAKPETVRPEPRSDAASPLEDLVRRDSCQNLLIFAGDGTDLFPAVDKSTRDFSHRLGGVAMRVTITRGLREMLAFPDLKKHCWQHLQPLRRRLR